MKTLVFLLLVMCLVSIDAQKMQKKIQNRKAQADGQKGSKNAKDRTTIAVTTTEATKPSDPKAPEVLDISKESQKKKDQLPNSNKPNKLRACGPGKTQSVVINEIRVRRIDYIELYGKPNTDLDGVYVLSIHHNGTIRVAIPLTNYSIPDDGYFFLSEHNDTVNGEAPDLVVPSFGVNSRRHSTVMLVCNYEGLEYGEVLDYDGDCQLDAEPWKKVLDSVSLANSRKSECVYSKTILDSANTRAYCHIFREPDGLGDFVANPTKPFGRDSPIDSPGRPNISA